MILRSAYSQDRQSAGLVPTHTPRWPYRGSSIHSGIERLTGICHQRLARDSDNVANHHRGDYQPRRPISAENVDVSHYLNSLVSLDASTFDDECLEILVVMFATLSPMDCQRCAIGSLMRSILSRPSSRSRTTGSAISAYQPSCRFPSFNLYGFAPLIGRNNCSANRPTFIPTMATSRMRQSGCVGRLAPRPQAYRQSQIMTPMMFAFHSGRIRTISFAFASPDE